MLLAFEACTRYTEGPGEPNLATEGLQILAVRMTDAQTTTQDDAYPIITAGRLADNSRVIQTHAVNLRRQYSHLSPEFDTPKTDLLIAYWLVCMLYFSPLGNSG
jgi:hypothetical protein